MTRQVLDLFKLFVSLGIPSFKSQNIRFFVADCLETLEEVNIRMREQWQRLGGGEFIFIPCLNDNPEWIEAMKDIILRDGEIN